MGAFTIKINQADMDNVKRMLADVKGAGARVTARAVNKTLAGVKTDASSEIRKYLNAKKETVDKTFKIKNASEASPLAFIASTGKQIPLIGLIGSAQRKAGVSVKVRKDGKRTVVPGTFIASMKSGHQGVFWRVDAGYKMPLKTPLVKNPRNRRRKITVQRLQVEERYAPRVPDYLQGGVVLTRVMSGADERLHKNITHELEYELSKHK